MATRAMPRFPTLDVEASPFSPEMTGARIGASGAMRARRSTVVPIRFSIHGCCQASQQVCCDSAY